MCCCGYLACGGCGDTHCGGGEFNIKELVVLGVGGLTLFKNV